MPIRIHPSWQEALHDEFGAPYFAELAAFVRSEYRNHTCYPPARWVFRAFDLCPFDEVRAVILGQDPYHGPGQAEGLCFSVPDGVEPPPSLRNILTEIGADLGHAPRATASLTDWARQGVLLLNTTLTVRAHQPASHAGHGWERFTDAAISSLSARRDHLVFFLWGSHAAKKAPLIDATRHLILRSPHPSPLSAYRGFFGSHQFTLAADYMRRHGKEPIHW